MKDLEKDCCDCKFFDGVCCMYKCKCSAILDTETSAHDCKQYTLGNYNQIELEQSNYQ